MKFIDILLKEGRKEDLKKKYSNKFDEETLDWILNISDLVDFNHKYTDWVLKVLDPNKSDLDMDVEVAVQLVNDFDKYQKQLEKKDIYKYKDLIELDAALVPLKVREKERELESQTKKIYEDDNFLVVIPETQESSCKYGSGTKWCVTQKGTDYFDRYTRGNQGLYFVLRKKGKQTDPHYKVAIHINESGTETWWDAKDSTMGNESIQLFKEYFPDLYEAVISDYKETRAKDDSYVKKVFDIKDYAYQQYANFQGTNKILKILVGGFENDSNSIGNAKGEMKIILNNVDIDEYKIYFKYKMSERYFNTWDISVGFVDKPNPEVDLKLGRGWGFDLHFSIEDTPKRMWDKLTRGVVHEVYAKIWNDNDLLKYVTGHSGPIWTPNRVNYGYTFGKNKGLIKKLVDWLDNDNTVGTKLDFLVDIGKLEKKVSDNGSVWYSHPSMNDWHQSSRWRGHFAGFFASAKNAGILDYRKSGGKYLLSQGPNFDAFKKGELKAL